MAHCTDLMKDRHLDQLLMCSLYIVNKVIGLNKNFTDIMKEYRNQPQAASHVYRSVLLGPEAKEDEDIVKQEEGVSRNKNPPPTPTRLAVTSTVQDDGEERGDLIKFYNMVFRKRLQEFVLKFSAKSSQQGRAPPLSPLPKLRSHLAQSPRRKVSENHSVYIRPLKAGTDEVVAYNPRSPHKPLQYSFSRSPAKNLDAINRLMRTEGERRSNISKRLLDDDGDGTSMENNSTTALEIAPGDTQMVIIQQEAGQPPAKVQIVGPGKVNSRLGIVLGERSVTDN